MQYPYVKPGWDYHCKLYCACVHTYTCTHVYAFMRVHMQVHMLGYVHVWEAVGQPRVSVLRTPSSLFLRHSFSWLETHRFI